ncbi:MAG: glycoside hydrolase family 65 protein [Solirubrobacterales bacterium]|nr:glycoside hydrolase family 65 protein [Solirubrobacterales bacterium]
MTAQHDPWAHSETVWSSDFAATSESLLALSNGYLGVRGTLDEGSPAAVPGTYLNGCFESFKIPYAERGYADPEFDQRLIDVTDGTRIRLIVEGEPLDVRTGTVLEHRRDLDLRSGQLVRSLRWQSPAGHEIVLRTRRIVSLKFRELAAIEYELEAAGPLRVTVHSELTTEVVGPGDSADPRAGGGLSADALVSRLATHDGSRALLVHETRASGQVVAVGMDNVLAAAPAHETTVQAAGSLARWTLSTTVKPGEPLRFVKMLAYHWAPGGDPAHLAADTQTSLDHACALGFEALVRGQREALDEVWAHADIELDGDPEIQHALRYALFQLHQNTARARGHAIPAKGLTGAGYNGHTFWDTEIFLLPVLTYCTPHHVEAALRWRASTLPAAQAKARRLGLRGAAFPWRTITGEECSGYMPAGIAAFHVNADIAHAVTRYVACTGDEQFDREICAPVLVETARLWASLGYHDTRRGGRFSIDGVTGPDEYSVLVDNNLYTNLMAQANLRAAIDAVERYGREALEVSPDEVAAWRQAADLMTFPRDAELGVDLQDEDFARREPFDFEAALPEEYPLLLSVPYFQIYRHQVVKQPDLVLAMVMYPDAFTAEQKRRNFAYYEALTVRDSSLAAGTQAVIAAELGDVQLAYDYLAEAALLDHHDLARNTGHGLHLAALAGGITAVIAGLGGARERDGRLSFCPRLPDQLSRIAFPFAFQGRVLRVEIASSHASYELLDGAPLQIEHWGVPLLLDSKQCAVEPIPPAPTAAPFRQPTGRAPGRRQRHGQAAARQL